MSITTRVLGCANAWAAANAATSGYLISSAQTELLMDCGHGVLSKLRAVADPFDLNAVVLSHLHADHCADLLSLAFLLTHHPTTGPRPRPRLLIPAGERMSLHAIASAFGHPDAFDTAFAVEELSSDGKPVTVADIEIRAATVPHSRPAVALDLRTDDGGRMTFSGDCGPNQQLVDLAHGTPLLVIEATMPQPTADHLSARAAGEIGRAAHADRVLLTHVCDAYDETWVLAQGSEGYGAPVGVCRPGLTVRS